MWGIRNALNSTKRIVSVNVELHANFAIRIILGLEPMRNYNDVKLYPDVIRWPRRMVTGPNSLLQPCTSKFLLDSCSVNHLVSLLAFTHSSRRLFLNVLNVIVLCRKSYCTCLVTAHI